MAAKYPGIPKVEEDRFFHFTLSNGQQLPCFVMEQIEGQDLEKWLENRQQPISQEQVIKWLRRLIETLKIVHQENLHRDIKPSSIMVRPTGELVLIDFGVVGLVAGCVTTQVGTPGYEAPELTKGQAVPQSDFFSLGRTFVHLFTGLNPKFFPEDLTGKLDWRDKAPQVSKPLADLIDNLMEPEWEKRPSTQEILERLNAIDRLLDESALTSEPIKKKSTLEQVRDRYLGYAKKILGEPGLDYNTLYKS